MKKLLFVCAGNTCRSPMAAALCNAKYGEDIHAESAGAFPSLSPINENALIALLDRGILPTNENPFASHSAREISEELFSEFDKVIALDASIYAYLTMMFPRYTEKLSVFDPPVSDPYGSPISVYKETLDEIEQGLNALVKTV